MIDAIYIYIYIILYRNVALIYLFQLVGFVFSIFFRFIKKVVIFVKFYKYVCVQYERMVIKKQVNYVFQYCLVVSPASKINQLIAYYFEKDDQMLFL